MKFFLSATFAAVCLSLAAVGCEGTSNGTSGTPVGNNGGTDVDVETGDPEGRGVHVNIGGGRIDVGAGGVDVGVGADGVNVDANGVKVDAEGSAAGAERRERIGEALDNLNVDVDAGGVKVDVN